jgi:hypothetical protein
MYKYKPVEPESDAARARLLLGVQLEREGTVLALVAPAPRA